VCYFNSARIWGDFYKNPVVASYEIKALAFFKASLMLSCSPTLYSHFSLAASFLSWRAAILAVDPLSTAYFSVKSIAFNWASSSIIGNLVPALRILSSNSFTSTVIAPIFSPQNSSFSVT
jgi:hypothetical protein